MEHRNGKIMTQILNTTKLVISTPMSGEVSTGVGVVVIRTVRNALTEVFYE